MIVIDNEIYGERQEFDSLLDAELTLQDMGNDFIGTTLTVRDNIVYDESGIAIGKVETSPSRKHRRRYKGTRA